MESYGHETCVMNDMVYPHGLDECVSGKCMVCVDGEWKERIELCQPSTLSSNIEPQGSEANLI